MSDFARSLVLGLPFIRDAINDSVNGYPDRRAERDPLETGEQAIAEMTRCPDCDGTGEWRVLKPGRGFMDGLRAGVTVEVCPFCNGTVRKRA